MPQLARAPLLKRYQSCSLVDATKELLRTTQHTYLHIYACTDITPHWLSLFVNGHREQPAACKVQALYEFLSGRKLEF